MLSEDHITMSYKDFKDCNVPITKLDIDNFVKKDTGYIFNHDSVFDFSKKLG